MGVQYCQLHGVYGHCTMCNIPGSPSDGPGKSRSLENPSRTVFYGSSTNNCNGGSSAAHEQSGSQRKRISIACGRCRKRKIRCSGDTGTGSPCTNCRNASWSPCEFLRVSALNTPFRDVCAPRANGFGYSMDASRQYQSRAPGGMLPTPPTSLPFPHAPPSASYPTIGNDGSASSGTTRYIYGPPPSLGDGYSSWTPGLGYGATRNEDESEQALGEYEQPRQHNPTAMSLPDRRSTRSQMHYRGTESLEYSLPQQSENMAPTTLAYPTGRLLEYHNSPAGFAYRPTHVLDYQNGFISSNGQQAAHTGSAGNPYDRTTVLPSSSVPRRVPSRLGQASNATQHGSGLSIPVFSESPAGSAADPTSNANAPEEDSPSQRQYSVPQAPLQLAPIQPGQDQPQTASMSIREASRQARLSLQPSLPLRLHQAREHAFEQRRYPHSALPLQHPHAHYTAIKSEPSDDQSQQSSEPLQHPLTAHNESLPHYQPRGELSYTDRYDEPHAQLHSPHPLHIPSVQNPRLAEAYSVAATPTASIASTGGDDSQGASQDTYVYVDMSAEAAALAAHRGRASSTSAADGDRFGASTGPMNSNKTAKDDGQSRIQELPDDQD